MLFYTIAVVGHDIRVRVHKKKMKIAQGSYAVIVQPRSPPSVDLEFQQLKALISQLIRWVFVGTYFGESASKDPGSWHYEVAPNDPPIHLELESDADVYVVLGGAST